MITQDLGIATAYGYAKSKGYTGTEAEFAELMASYASTAQTAIEAADRAVEANTAAQSAKTDASASKTAAQTAAQTATSKASEASQSASTATTKASEASQSASTASAAATSASTSVQTATTAAATATTKASEAAESATTATTAKTDAETARDAAAQSASEAAESARTLTIDATLTQSGQAADSKATGDKIGALKSAFDILEETTAESYNASTRIESETTYTQGYIQPSGVPKSSTAYYYTNKISVEPGDIVTSSGISGSPAEMRVVTAYNGDDAIESAGRERVTSYTVPSGVNGIIITGSSTFYTGQYTVKIDRTTKHLKNKSVYFPNPFRYKPIMDHLFVGIGAQYIIIPHESVYHVRISKSLGFNVIEANVQKTSDGHYFVNHLESGKFGKYFHHVDGTTDISNIAASSVTWAWIVANVRYNSTIEKFRTRPCTLDEFLGECKQQNLIPFVTSNDSDVVDIVRGYMGDGFVAYNATRAVCPTEIIAHWKSLTTKADILSYCDTIGKPFIYSMQNPTDFTEQELKDIIATLHANGYLIATSYVDTKLNDYIYLGFDMIASQSMINRIEQGNKVNVDTLYSFNDFTVSGATETNGTLVFSADGEITLNGDQTIHDAAMVDVEVWFNGEISIYPTVSSGSHLDYTSDGTKPVFISAPVIHGRAIPKITATNGTTIFNISVKASVI